MAEKVKKEMWKCYYCGELYNSQEEAEKCEDVAREYMNFPDKKYKWYKLKSAYSNDVNWVFARKVTKHDRNSYSTCRGNSIHIYHQYYNEYYEVFGERPEWIIEEVLGIKEAYEKYGIVLENIRYFGEYPVDIIKQFEEVEKLEKAKLTEKYLKIPVNELVKELIEIKHPNLFLAHEILYENK